MFFFGYSGAREIGEGAGVDWEGKYKNVIDFESTGTGESRLMISFMLVIMITTKYNITYIYNDNDSIYQYFGSLITHQSLSFHILFLDY